MFPGDALNAEAVEALTASNLTWPASMLGPESTRALRCDEFARALMLVQKDLGIPMVVGALTIDGLRMERNEGKITLGFDRKYNSALLIADGRIDPDRYDKHSLTPFGEAIPYAWRIPALQRAVLALGAGGMKFDLSWGERSGPLHVPATPTTLTATPTPAKGVRFVTPICFEVVRSNLCRRLVHEGDPSSPVLIVNISNDGWFTDWPEGRAQHFQIARWRSIELGVPMVRSVNTGVSGAIDAQGRVLAKGIPGPWEGAIESHTSGVLTLDVPIARASTTPFSRWFGNAPGYGCLVATVVLILASRRWGRGRRDDALPGSNAPARTPTA
jgi:apolipoprotein N-acyltransferase